MFARALVFSGLAAAVGFGFWATNAGATVMVPLSIEQMSKEAAVVVRARVTQQEARWDEGKKRIFTHTKLEVVDPIHRTRSIGATIEVRTLGGELDGLGMKVAGEARFVPDEQVIVFLAADDKAPGLFRVIGMSQGKFHLDRDQEGRWFATPSLEGVAFAKRDADGVLRVNEEARADGRMPLEDLRRRVLTALEPQVTPAHVPSTPNKAPTP